MNEVSKNEITEDSTKRELLPFEEPEAAFDYITLMNKAVEFAAALTDSERHFAFSLDFHDVADNERRVSVSLYQRGNETTLPELFEEMKAKGCAEEIEQDGYTAILYGGVIFKFINV